MVQHPLWGASRGSAGEPSADDHPHARRAFRLAAPGCGKPGCLWTAGFPTMWQVRARPGNRPRGAATRKTKMRAATVRACPTVLSIGQGLPVLALLLAAACAPVPDPSAGLTTEESVALIDQVEPSDVALETVAETFALGTRATDVQRESLEVELVGRRVEWDIPVYEVSLREGRYEVTSQPIPIQYAEATPLIRVMVVVVPRNESDEALLRAVKTDDVVRVRGIVQEIRLRTVVALVPAMVVSGPSDPKTTIAIDGENQGESA
jgi:hypothetical protein